MVEFFHARRLRYEIMAMIDQRWQIIKTIDDSRVELGRQFARSDFDRLEAEVERLASAILARAGIAAVRVIREREREDGFVTRTEIINRAAPKLSGEAKTPVLDVDGPIPVCQTPDDLFGRPAAKVLSTMLRPLLDKLAMTPIELVTLEATSLTVVKQESVFDTAIARAARAQVGDGDASAIKQRDAALTLLVQKSRARLKQAQTNRSLPALGPDGFDALLARLSARAPRGEQRFLAFHLLSAQVKGQSLLAKLDYVLNLLTEDLSPAGAALLDEFIAGLIDSPMLIKDILGNLGNLKSALMSLAVMAAGRSPDVASPDALAPRLAAEFARGRLPLSHEAIWVRILRSVAGRQRMTRGELSEEWAELTALQRVLKETVPEIWLEQLSAAIVKRQATLRQEMIDRG